MIKKEETKLPKKLALKFYQPNPIKTKTLATIKC